MAVPGLAAVLQQRYVFASVATGMGKTLSFLAPVLFRPDGVLVIVTPLNLNVLGNQMEELLEKAGISVISIDVETATDENFKITSKRSLYIVMTWRPSMVRT